MYRMGLSPPSPIFADTIGARWRRLSAVAAASNPLINNPWTVASNWASGTTYKVGNAVINGGNVYLCYVAGTSAGSGGPSGTGTGPIVDNTAQWIFGGVSPIGSSDPLAPSFSITTSLPGGISLGFTPDLSGKFLFAGGTPTATVFGATVVAFPATHTLIGGGTGGNTGLANGTNNYYWSATFYTDAPKVAIGVGNSTAAGRVIIDGRYYSMGGDSSNAALPVYWILDFSSVGARKARKITIEQPGNAWFFGAYVDPASKVWAPPVYDNVKAYVFGSSMESGGNSFPIDGSRLWTTQLGKLLGWSDVANGGLGGSGYVITTTDYTYAQHITDCTSYAPDVVLIGGPVNDVGLPGVQAAALSFFQSLRSALPKAVIIALGAWGSNGGPAANTIAAENSVAAAVTQFGDGLTFFIPDSTDPTGSWVNGTGNVSSPTGTGNSDVYTSSDGHPVQAGIDYRAQRYARAIRSTVLTSSQLDRIPLN